MRKINDQVMAEVKKKLLDAGFQPSNEAEMKISALEKQVAELKDSLNKIKSTLNSANESGLINDTIWMQSGIETLFDFIDYSLEIEK